MSYATARNEAKAAYSMYRKVPKGRVAEIKREICAELKSQLNRIGRNLTNKRIAAVMKMIREKYGYGTVTKADILLEVHIFVEKLRQECPIRYPLRENYRFLG